MVFDDDDDDHDGGDDDGDDNGDDDDDDDVHDVHDHDVTIRVARALKDLLQLCSGPSAVCIEGFISDL